MEPPRSLSIILPEGINALLRRARKISDEEWQAEQAQIAAHAEDELAETGDAEPTTAPIA